MRSRKIAAVVIAVALVTGCGLLLIARSGHPSGQPPASTSSGWIGMVRAGIRQSRGKPIFRPLPFHGIHAEPKMPVSLRHGALRTLGGGEGLQLEFDHARYVMTPAHVGLWVVQGKAVTCIFRDLRPATACDTTTHVEKYGLDLEVYHIGDGKNASPDRFLLLGIVPDRVNAVRLSVRGHPSVDPVSSNTFGRRAEAPIHFRSLVP